jgi:hypothetical protein
MNKLLLFIALLAINIQAQTEVWSDGVRAFWSDSLYQDYTGVVDSTDSIATFKLAFKYEWMNLTVQDSGTVYDDTCVVEYPVFTLHNKAITDTIWQRVQFMRDSSWTAIVGGAIPIDDNSVHSYQIFVGDYEAIRLRMTNAVIVAGRVWRFWATLSTKK